MNAWQELAPATIASALVFGVLLVFLGCIQPSLAKRLNMDAGRAGALPAVFNLALIPLILASGILIDHVGVKAILILGSLLGAVGTFALAITRTFPGAIYGVVVLSAGGACLNTGAMVLMPDAFFASSAAASVNFGMVWFGLGALMTPTLVGSLTRLLSFRRSLGVLAIVCLVPALATIWFGGERMAANVPTTHPGEVLKHPLLWLTALMFCLYAPLEGLLGTWTAAYLQDLGYQAGRAAWYLTGFWLSFLSGRLLAAWFQQRRVLADDFDPWLILVLALLAVVTLGNMAGTHHRGIARAGVLLVGAFLGPIFPTLVAYFFGHCAGGDRGTAYGCIYAIGATGSLILPPMIASYARRTSVRKALRLAVGVALGLAAAALALVVQ